MRVLPAGLDHGIKFRRVDRLEGDKVSGGTGAAALRDIPATAHNVSAFRLGTTLSNTSGDSVATVEHLMAACIGMGLDNLLIEIDGPEVPILDGSSWVFCELLQTAGVVVQDGYRKVLRLLETVEVKDGDKWARLSPTVSDALSLRVRIDFDDRVIGTQEAFFRLSSHTFDSDIAFARTFGFSKDIHALQANGFAKGGSLDNAILIDDGCIVNPEGLRSPDEFVKHKLLDAVGDLALAGGYIAGYYEAEKPGHALNNALVRTLLDRPEAWRWEEIVRHDIAQTGSALHV